MKFGYTTTIIIYVTDVGASIAFFQKALGLKTHFQHESGYGELEIGGTHLPSQLMRWVRAICLLGTFVQMPRPYRLKWKWFHTLGARTVLWLSCVPQSPLE